MRDEVTDKAPERAERRVVEHDSPGRLVKLREFPDLKSHKGGKESGAETDQSRFDLSGFNSRVQHQHNAGEPCNGRDDQPPGNFRVPSQHHHKYEERHEDRVRVVQRETRRERQKPHRIEPDRHREGADEASLEVTENIRRPDCAVSGEDPPSNQNHTEKRPVTDEFKE